MADSWGEYFYGSDEQIEADRRRRQAEYDRIIASKADQVLKRLGDKRIPGGLLGLQENMDYDPREVRLAMMQDTMRPSVETDFGRDMDAAGRMAKQGLDTAWSAVFETTMRPRDTLIRAAQEYNQGNEWDAAKLAARAPLSMVYWPAAAGTPGSPDDWREDARKRGISEGNIMAIDIFTDPETYLPVPIPFMAAGRAARYAKPLGRMPPLLDESGDAVRRLTVLGAP